MGETDTFVDSGLFILLPRLLPFLLLHSPRGEEGGQDESLYLCLFFFLPLACCSNNIIVMWGKWVALQYDNSFPQMATFLC